MDDKVNTARRLSLQWLALARHLAVGAGALVALVSLIVDAPLETASLRGALTVIALLVVTRYAHRAIAWALAARDADGPAAEEPAASPLAPAVTPGSGRRPCR